jgi:hypothetical protein
MWYLHIYMKFYPTTNQQFNTKVILTSNAGPLVGLSVCTVWLCYRLRLFLVCMIISLSHQRMCVGILSQVFPLCKVTMLWPPYNWTNGTRSHVAISRLDEWHALLHGHFMIQWITHVPACTSCATPLWRLHCEACPCVLYHMRCSSHHSCSQMMMC